MPGRQDSRAAGDGVRDQDRQQRPAANVGRGLRRQSLGAYDPENGFIRELDYNIVPAARRRHLIRVTNAAELATTYSIEAIPPAAPTVLGILDFRRSSGHPARADQVVLILPIGACSPPWSERSSAFAPSAPFRPRCWPWPSSRYVLEESGCASFSNAERVTQKKKNVAHA